MARTESGSKAGQLIAAVTALATVVATIVAVLAYLSSRSEPAPGPSATAVACPGRLCVDPVTGPARTLVTVHGTGYGPGETITVKLAGEDVASARSDDTGAFDATFLISSSYAGRGRTELTVSAQGETGPPQSTVFVLTTT